MWYGSPNWILQDRIVFSFAPNENRIFLPNSFYRSTPNRCLKPAKSEVCVCVCVVCEKNLIYVMKAITISCPRNKGLFSTDEGSFLFNFIFPIMITKVQQLIMFYCWSLHIIVIFFPNSTMQFGVCVLFIQYVCASQHSHSCLFCAGFVNMMCCVCVCM